MSVNNLKYMYISHERHLTNNICTAKFDIVCPAIGLFFLLEYICLCLYEYLYIYEVAAVSMRRCRQQEIGHNVHSKNAPMNSFKKLRFGLI
jgi:hypothetical protein